MFRDITIDLNFDNSKVVTVTTLAHPLSTTFRGMAKWHVGAVYWGNSTHWYLSFSTTNSELCLAFVVSFSTKPIFGLYLQLRV